MDSKIHHKHIELWYGTPLWLVRVLLLLFLVTGVCLLSTVFYYEDWLPNDPIWLKYFILLLGVSFVSSGLIPRYWRRWPHFTAARDGLRFPSDFPLKSNSTWLLVPWEDVGVIKVSRFFGRKQGVAIEIAIKDDDKDKYFPGKRLVEEIFGKRPSDPRFTIVGYAEAFNNRFRVVKKLNELKEKFAL